jgi:hypothetical protein
VTQEESARQPAGLAHAVVHHPLPDFLGYSPVQA